MNREQVYVRWMTQRWRDGKICARRDTIERCRELSDGNFIVFYNYAESITEDTAFRQRRSVILDFLVYINHDGVELENLLQENIDSYFQYCKNVKDESDNNINKKVSFINSFLIYYNDIIKNELNASKFRIGKAKMKVINPMKSLTVKQMEQCREFYRGDYEKLYIIEMFYETGITDDELAKLKYSNFDIVSRSFEVDGNIIKVSHRLANIIEAIKSSKVFKNNYYAITLLEHIKEDLQELGIENINPQDFKKTRKNMMFKCPQCNKEYEANVENWCAKQFRNDGEFWIVCRVCGEEE